MKLDLPKTHCVGRYKLIKHEPHVFDDAGNLVQLGAVIEEGPWCGNAVVPAGLAFMLNAGVKTLMSSFGAIIETSTTRRIDPDSNGRVWWRTRYRFHKPRTGASEPVLETISKGSVDVSSTVPIWVPLGGSFVPLKIGQLSLSDLIGADGESGSVTVDRSNEDIDLIWEFTEYIPAEEIGVVRGWTLKPKAGTFDAVDYAYKIRPANFNNVSDSSKGWGSMTGSSFIRFGTTAAQCKAGLGTLRGVDQAPDFTESYSALEASAGVETYKPNPDSPAVGALRMKWDFGAANDGINLLHVVCGHYEYQISFDPPIDKKAIHQLDIVMLLMARDGGGN